MNKPDENNVFVHNFHEDWEAGQKFLETLDPKQVKTFQTNQFSFFGRGGRVNLRLTFKNGVTMELDDAFQVGNISQAVTPLVDFLIAMGISKDRARELYDSYDGDYTTRTYEV